MTHLDPPPPTHLPVSICPPIETLWQRPWVSATTVIILSMRFKVCHADFILRSHQKTQPASCYCTWHASKGMLHCCCSLLDAIKRTGQRIGGLLLQFLDGLPFPRTESKQSQSWSQYSQVRARVTKDLSTPQSPGYNCQYGQCILLLSYVCCKWFFGYAIETSRRRLWENALWFDGERHLLGVSWTLEIPDTDWASFPMDSCCQGVAIHIPNITGTGNA